MSFPEFVDRDEELAQLEQALCSAEADLLIVYGRRRVGKSELVRRAIEDRDDAVYHQASETTPKRQLERFIEDAASAHPSLERLREDWEVVLESLGEEGAVIVIDEFPYLVEATPSLPSQIQRVWDLHLQRTGATLILVGSSISVMEDELLAGDSPLFGRRTGTLDLQPLAFPDMLTFLSDWAPEPAVLAWTIFGGMPHYLQAIDPDATLEENVTDLILSPQGLLHDEPEFLLRQEVSKPTTYMGILEAIAAGNHAPNEIATTAGLETGSVGTYLSKLKRLRLVDRAVPATEDPRRSKKGHYHIRDPLLDFWFRFVQGREAELERQLPTAFERIVAPELADHAAWHFEELCRRLLPRLLELPYRRIGSWWHRDKEIDIAATTTGPEIVLGECKFSSNPVDKRLLGQLEEKSKHVRWQPAQEQGDRKNLYVLFSRSGFRDPLVQAAAEREDVRLFSLPDLIEAC